MPVKEDPAYRNLQPVFNNLLASGWTMFDLRALRQNFDAAANPELAALVFGFDILVLVPEGRPERKISI